MVEALNHMSGHASELLFACIGVWVAVHLQNQTRRRVYYLWNVQERRSAEFYGWPCIGTITFLHNAGFELLCIYKIKLLVCRRDTVCGMSKRVEVGSWPRMNEIVGLA